MTTTTTTELSHSINKTNDNAIKTAAPSISFYAGPVTKHPLIQKYLYWPLRELTTSINKSTSGSTNSKIYKTYSTSKDDSSSAPRKNEADKSYNDSYQSTRSKKTKDFNLKSSNYQENERSRKDAELSSHSSYLSQQASRFTPSIIHRKTLGIGSYTSSK